MNSSAPAPPIPAPAAIETDARAWCAPLVRAAGDALRALYLYGSALRPGFDPEKSDVNVLLVVKDASFATLDALARALPETASTGRRYTPLVLPEDTLRRSPDVFPLDFLDLLELRALLHGEDVFAGVRVGLANMRHQCEYELRSKLIGTRQAYLASRGAAGAAHAILARAAGGSAALYRHLLALRGVANPETREQLASAVAQTYGVDAAGLEAPFAERAATGDDDARARARLERYVVALERLTVAVDDLPTT
jgi:hypothetical protein